MTADNRRPLDHHSNGASQAHAPAHHGSHAKAAVRHGPRPKAPVHHDDGPAVHPTHHAPHARAAPHAKAAAHHNAPGKAPSHDAPHAKAPAHEPKHAKAPAHEPKHAKAPARHAKGPAHPKPHYARDARAPAHSTRAPAKKRKPHHKSGDGHGMRPWVKLAAGGAVLLVIALATVLLVHHREAAKKPVAQPPKIAVTTVTATKGDIGIYLDSIGTVTPVYTAAITSQVTGTIVAVHYEEGQLVKKGDPLIDIDPRPYEATLVQARGTLSRDQNLLAQAKMDRDRYQAAWQKNAIAKQQLDDQEKVVLQDEGTVTNDQGTVQYDQVQVDFCHIVSPIDGRVGLRLVDPGNLVQATGSTTLVVVTQLAPITAIFTVAEDSLGQVAEQTGAGAKLTVDAYDRVGHKKLATGALITLDNQIDTTTGTVKGRALFPNTDGALFANQFVNTRLLVKTLHDATLVPHSAIQQNGDKSFVYVVSGDEVHNQPVKTGATEGGVTQVDGLKPGDVLANSSFDKLHDGAHVAATAAPPGSAEVADGGAPGAAGATPTGTSGESPKP